MVGNMNSRINGPWSLSQIEEYLSETVTPMRISVGGADYPLLCSVWFYYDAADGLIRCISHERSELIKSLLKHPRCSFDISPNQPPYKGVRGRGSVVLKKGGATELLTRLMNRHLGGTDSALSQWLLGRAAEETTIEIKPVSFSTWDYSARMQ